jgi:hypothetical protein
MHPNTKSKPKADATRDLRESDSDVPSTTTAAPRRPGPRRTRRTRRGHGTLPLPTLKAKTLEFIRERGEVTFVDLWFFLESIGVPHSGDWAVAEPDDAAVYLWTGMSEPFLRVVLELFDDGAIVVHPRPELAEDGVMPALPLAPETPRQPGDATEYWRPVVLVPDPPTPVARPCRNMMPWPRSDTAE